MFFAAAPILAALTCFPEITSTADSNGTRVPAGTIGYGIVLSNIPASNRARNGIIVLSPRFLMLGGTQMQVAGDPSDASILTHGPNPVAEGAGALPVPGLGLAVSEGVHGTNIGNLLERGPCVEK